MPPRKRRGFGRIERRTSGRYRAAYLGPDKVLHRADRTFEAKEDAEAWLADRRREIVNKTWNPPAAPVVKAKALTFGEYATSWLDHRDLKPRTRSHYQSLFTTYLEPAFGTLPLTAITPTRVRSWHATVATGRPTTRAHAYGLLRTILGTAVTDEHIAANPAHIRGAGATKRRHKIEPLTLTQLERLVAAMPEKHRVLTLLAAWCGLRFGELAELRRKDVDLNRGILKVRRGVVRVDGTTLVGDPKSEAGGRDVAIPPHLMPLVREHIATHAGWGRDGLLFPGVSGGHLAPSSLYGRAPTARRTGWGFYAARVEAGVPTLRWHDLRHTGAVLAAQTGATLAELMARLGHSTPTAALRYQHAALDRDKVIADALSRLAEVR
jgi:integrase